MGVIGALTNTTSRLAHVTTAAAGAAGGAAVGAALGAVRGAARGAGTGASAGPNSTVAKALGIAALGVTGIVDWPLVVAAGGAALLVDRLSRRGRDTADDPDDDVASGLALGAAPLEDSRQPRAADLAEPAAPALPAKAAPEKPAAAADSPANKAPVKTAPAKTPPTRPVKKSTPRRRPGGAETA